MLNEIWKIFLLAPICELRRRQAGMPVLQKLIAPKTNKELAFLHELFVATDWGERFAELIDKHVELPREGRALYVASGTGGHAIALQERAGDALEFLCVDENEESLELARAKTDALKLSTEFRQEKVDNLAPEDDHFKLVVGDGSLVHSERVPKNDRRNDTRRRTGCDGYAQSPHLLQLRRVLFNLLGGAQQLRSAATRG